MSLSGLQFESDCQSCPIRRNAVCSRCDAEEIRLLEQIKYYRHYEQGQMIVWAGDDMGFVASVVTGVATLSQTLEDGRKQMVGLSLPGDFVGRPGRESSSYDVQAASDVSLCCFRRRPFEEMMRGTPHVAERLLEMTMDELDSARQWMLILGRKTAREKIASFLMILAFREQGLAGIRGEAFANLTLPLTREAIADYLGLTLETVSRQISALRREGVISQSGAREIHVPDLARLNRESGDDISALFPAERPGAMA